MKRDPSEQNNPDSTLRVKLVPAEVPDADERLFRVLSVLLAAVRQRSAEATGAPPDEEMVPEEGRKVYGFPESAPPK